jgi:aminopeptidase N
MSKTKIFALFISISLALIFIDSIYAQSLPLGKYHRIRERIIDLIHYKAELNINFDQREVAGKVSITFRPLCRSNIFQIDAIRLNIEGIDLLQKNTIQPLTYNHHDQVLDVILDQQYSPKDTLTITISYSAQPNAGMYFLKDYEHEGQFYVYSYGEGGLHANWLPIYKDVNDKFSTEMVITVPQPYTVISNGNLINVKKHNSGEQTFHWKQDLPHSNYLISIYVGQFEKGDLPPALGTIPLSYWVPEGRLKQGAYALRITTKMVEFFSNKFNYKYPWDKYDQVAFPDYSIGAMEHTSVTGHRASVLRDEKAPDNFGPPDFDRYYQVWSADAIISHELAHHWFGDNLTCRNLNYLWLNESFATYCNMLWDEELLGIDAFHLVRREALDRYLNYVAKNHVIRPLEYAYYDAPGDMYNIEITYFKGALILHTLRNILGDEDFFRTMSYFLHKHEFSNVISTDFKIAIEEVTGRNLDWFFDDWIYGGGYPIFEVSYNYLSDQKLVDLTIKQIQPIIEGQDLFTLPVEITIVTSKGMKKETVWVKNKVDQFLLNCDEKPLMVSFDGKGTFVSEIRFDKSLPELIYQINNDELLGRIWALRQLAQKYTVHPKTLQTISNILSGQCFWGLKAEAALLLGELRTTEAVKEIEIALKSPDYRVRKAAVLALPNFKLDLAEKILKNVIKKDTHIDVIATAIVALARTKPDANIDFIRQQINRPAWYDEIRLSCLQAFEIIGNKQLVPDIKPFTNEKYHEHIRNSALDAWKSCAPHDLKLHQVLMHCAGDAQPGVRSHAVGMLGDLYVKQAVPLLEKIVDESGDIDLQVTAESALNEIKRINKE